VLGVQGVEQRDRTVQKKVVAAGDDQQPLVGGRTCVAFGEIDGVRLHPLFHEVLGKQPLAGDFGGRQPFLRYERVDHFLVDVDELGHFSGREEFGHGKPSQIEALMVVNGSSIRLSISSCQL
jgi:hypothetical protein